MGKFLKRFFAACLCLVIPVILCSCDEKHTEHTFSQEWSTSDTHHWHDCTIDGCSEKGSNAEHNWNAGVVEGHNTVYTCETCGKTKTNKNACVAGSEWVKDETHHWHACTIDGCDEKVDKSTHNWDNGTVSGHKTIYTCVDCGQTKEETNACVAGDEWIKDENYHWHTCTIDGCTEKVDYATHNWGTKVTSGHNYIETCETCGQTKTEPRPCVSDTARWESDDENHWHVCIISGCDKVVNDTLAEHNFVSTNIIDGHDTIYECSVCKRTKNVKNDCTATSTWSKDEKHHWHNCTVSGCLEQLDKAEHNWDEGTSSSNGVVFTCIDCGQTRDECGNCNYSSIWSKDEDYHWHNCLTNGCTGSADKAKHNWSTPVLTNHKNVYTCTVCGQTKEETVPHSFMGAEWKKDETHHWHICTVAGCTQVDEKVEHNFGTPVLEGHTHKYACTVCGQTKEETAPCDYTGVDWSKDETHHWHECIIEGCNEPTKAGDIQEHNWSTPIVSNHKNVYTCIVCGQTKEETIQHNFEGDSWVSDETYHWHKCTVDGCIETDTKLTHKYGDPVVANHKNVYTCTDCEYKKYEDIPHTYVWDKGNNTNHWQKCTVAGCTSTINHSTHNWSEPTVSNHKNNYYCPTCEATKEETLACEFADKLTYDETYHWQKCTIDGCTEVKGKAEHNMGTPVVDGDKTTTSCQSCDYESVKWANIYIRGYEQIAYNPYKVVVKDVKVRLNTYQNLDFAELHLGLNEEGNLVGFGYCTLTEPDENNVLFGLAAVIENDTLYLVNLNDGNQNIGLMQLKDIKNLLNISLYNVVPGGLDSITNILMQVSTTFSEEINYVMSALINSYNRAETNANLHALYEYFYNVEEKNGVYVYTFDFDALRNINTFLNTKKISEIVDLAFGQGAFEILVEFLQAGVDFKVSDWIALGQENGFDIFAVLDYLDVMAQKAYTMMAGGGEPVSNDMTEEPQITLETFIGMMTGMEIPDISEMLKPGTVEEPNPILDLTIVDVINMINQMNAEENVEVEPVTAGQVKGLITMVAEDYCSLTPYALAKLLMKPLFSSNVEQITPNPNDMSAQNTGTGAVGDTTQSMYESFDIYTVVDEAITMIEQLGSITLTTALDGTIESLKIVLATGMVDGSVEIVKSNETNFAKEYDDCINNVNELKALVDSIVITEDSLPVIKDLANKEAEITENEDYTLETSTDANGNTVRTYTNIYENINEETGYIYIKNNIYEFVYDANGNFVKYTYTYYSKYRSNLNSYIRETNKIEFIERVVDSETGEVTMYYSYIDENTGEDGFIDIYNQYHSFIFDANGNFVEYNYNEIYKYQSNSESSYNERTEECTFVYNKDLPLSIYICCDGWIELGYLDTYNMKVHNSLYRDLNGNEEDSAYYEPVSFNILFNFLTQEVLINEIDYIDKYCDRKEVIEDRIETEYGYLLHYVCSECGSERYEQISYFLDSNISNGVMNYYNDYVNNSINYGDGNYYALEDLIVKNNNRYYQYDAELSEFVVIFLTEEQETRLDYVAYAGYGEFYTLDVALVA